jgi:histidinol dehydrogenase
MIHPSNSSGPASAPTASMTLHDLSGSDTIPPSLLLRSEADLSEFMVGVRPILEAVRIEGDTALKRFAREFDNVEVDNLSIRVTSAEIEEAFRSVSKEIHESLAFAIANLRRYHEAQKPAGHCVTEIRPGVWAGDRFLPIDSVACYVPRGKGVFPSVALMTTIPAVVAGVIRPVILTPAGPDGAVDPATLVAARLIGIKEIYKCGGAHAVAAVAYGTESVPKCDKIVGPGSRWLVAAKRTLSHLIDTGMPAGPTEAIILADDTADGSLAALDLIIESEHGPDSAALLVTDSRRVCDEAREAVEGYWRGMGPVRQAMSRTVLTGPRGGVVLTKSRDASIDFVNAYAPEHVEILTAEPMATLGRIRNAGEALLGRYTPLSIGNFTLGVNGVLPTGGAARTYSPLSVADYMKRMSVGYVTEAAYPLLASHAHRLAQYEGFDGHAQAVSDLRIPLLHR